MTHSSTLKIEKTPRGMSFPMGYYTMEFWEEREWQAGIHSVCWDIFSSKKVSQHDLVCSVIMYNILRKTEFFRFSTFELGHIPDGFSIWVCYMSNDILQFLPSSGHRFQFFSILPTKKDTYHLPFVVFSPLITVSS